MHASMTVAQQAIPIGAISLHFQYLADDDPPQAWLDIHSDSADDNLGGLALNGLKVGDMPRLAGLYGRSLAFPDQEDAEGGELGESVLWLPGDETLELISLSLSFGQARDGQLPFELHARCFDHHGGYDIPVHIQGAAGLTTPPG